MTVYMIERDSQLDESHSNVACFSTLEKAQEYLTQYVDKQVAAWAKWRSADTVRGEYGIVSHELDPQVVADA